MLKITAKALWIGLKASYAAKTSASEIVEVLALCALYSQRYDRPQGNLLMGQARAVIRRAWARQETPKPVQLSGPIGDLRSLDMAIDAYRFAGV